MALNVDKLRRWPVTTTDHRQEAKDTMLYALGIGLGADPIDERQLKFVHEQHLQALPTMATVLGGRFPWLRDPDTGIDLKKMLHGESSLVVHSALPASGEFRGRVSIDGIVDRGIEKGAGIYFRHDVHAGGDDALLATVRGCFVVRNGGGCGSTGFAAPIPHAVPARPADAVFDLSTLRQAALIYRLSGDRNPLHAEPAVARAAGFDRPILHGLCTYGVVCHALLANLCDYQPARMRRLDVRYSAPLYPGETLRTDVWDEGAGVYAFRATALERGTVVLNNGHVEVHP